LLYSRHCVFVVLQLHNVEDVAVVHCLELLLHLQLRVVLRPVHSHISILLSNNDMVVVCLHNSIDVVSCLMKSND